MPVCFAQIELPCCSIFLGDVMSSPMAPSLYRKFPKEKNPRGSIEKKHQENCPEKKPLR